MQSRAVEYWNDTYLRYTDAAGGAPHDLRDQLKAAFGAGVSYKARLHFDVLNLGHVPQTTLERMRRQRMQGAPEAHGALPGQMTLTFSVAVACCSPTGTSSLKL